MPAVSDISAFHVFLAIASVGFIFLPVSLIFGEIFGHFGDAHFDTLDHGGPSFLSPRMLAISFALTYLKAEGLVEQPRYAKWQLTSLVITFA